MLQGLIVLIVLAIEQNKEKRVILFEQVNSFGVLLKKRKLKTLAGSLIAL